MLPPNARVKALWYKSGDHPEAGKEEKPSETVEAQIIPREPRAAATRRLGEDHLIKFLLRVVVGLGLEHLGDLPAEPRLRQTLLAAGNPQKHLLHRRARERKVDHAEPRARVVVEGAERERRRPPRVDARELERRNVRVRGGDVDVRRRKGLARERHEVRDVFVVPRFQAARDLVARRVALLEVLRRPDAAHGALDHDADAVAEEVGLAHRVRRQDDSAALHRHLDEVPEIPLRSWIQARRRLVQQHHRGAADQRHRDRQLALHAPRQAPGGLVRMVQKLHPRQSGRDGVFHFILEHPQSSKQSQMIGAAQRVPQRVVLVHDRQMFGRLREGREDRGPRDRDVARRRLDGAHDRGHGRRLARAVRT
mmetsp:Transcript_8775/g.25052  ORF Transcript_8775/g.25052 Transcript_8775/m.25052 type:complete len:366 (-) Transcript_8775:5468-6565(-)